MNWCRILAINSVICFVDFLLTSAQNAPVVMCLCVLYNVQYFFLVGLLSLLLFKNSLQGFRLFWGRSRYPRSHDGIAMLIGNRYRYSIIMSCLLMCQPYLENMYVIIWFHHTVHSSTFT